MQHIAYTNHPEAARNTQTLGGKPIKPSENLHVAISPALHPGNLKALLLVFTRFEFVFTCLLIKIHVQLHVNLYLIVDLFNASRLCYDKLLITLSLLERLYKSNTY